MKKHLLLLILIVPHLAISQFTADIRLTNADSISYTPYNNSRCIAVNGQSVHITWTDRRDDNGEVYYKRSLDGGVTWSADQRLSPDDGFFSGRATIAVWGNEVHLVWMERRDGQNEMYYKRSTDNGTTWGGDVRLTNNASNSEYPSLAVHFQSLHLVWNDDRHGMDEIYYKRSLNGGLDWSPDMRLTNNAGDSYKASVAVSESIVHVAWEDLRNGTSEIFYKKSMDNGDIWGNDVKLSNSISDCYAPCISANGPIVFLGWDDNRTNATEIYCRRSVNNGDTWAPEFNMSNTVLTSYNVNHIFSGTFMFLVWNEEVGGELEIHSRFSTDAGLTWNPTRPLTTAAGESDQPFVGIGGSAVHVVWRDDRDGNSEIYYKRNPNGNPFDHINSLAYGHSLGNINKDVAFAVTSDIYSNVYVAGTFSGTVDFDPGPAIANLTAAGNSDVFVYKLSPEGELVWARRAGGSEIDVAYGIALDAQWNVLVTGSFQGTADFDPGSGNPALISMGLEDAFVLKLDNRGDFRWARRMGGAGRDESRSIVASTNNDVLTTGSFSSTGDFDPGPNVSNLISNGEEDIFISQLDDDGNFIRAVNVGGEGFDGGRSITIDADGDIITTGYFHDEADFDPGAGVFNISSAGGSDIFILKMDTSGDFTWAARMGGDEDDEGNSVTTDLTGHIYSTGYFRDVADFNPGSETNNLQSAGSEDIFISKLDESGHYTNAWVMGGPNTDEGRAITSHNGFLYVTGHFQSTADFHPGIEKVELRASGSSDIFLQKLSNTGEFIWLNQFGGTQEDIGYTLSPVSFGKISVAGSFTGTAEFSPEIELQSYTSAGNEDVFVSVIRDCLPSSSTIDLTVCDSYSIPFPDTTFIESGVYTLIMESSDGCDSIVTLNLTVLTSQETSVTEIACDSYTTPSGQNTWTESGTYSEVLGSINGCDSIITYHLTILQSSQSSSDVEACDMYLTPEGETLTESGDYEFDLINAVGCDSIHTLHLTIHRSTASSILLQACDSYTTPDGDSTWTESGVHTFTIPNAAGCDSVITLDLTIIDLDVQVSLLEGILSADLTGVAYQWVDCNENYALIEEETGQTFSPVASGFYAVIAFQGECADTSACIEAIVVGIDDPDNVQQAFVYPNPVKDKLYVRLPQTVSALGLCITDMHGKKVMEKDYAEVSLIELDLDQPSGIYMLTLISQGYRKTWRIMK